MKNSKSQEFAARIADASRTELTVIVYDVILEDLKEAREAANDRQEYRHLVQHAARFVNELMSTLDFRYKLAFELWSLYEYIGGQLYNSSFSGKTELLDQPQKMLESLREAFAKVAEQDTSGPLMANTQKITSGITYGKNSLNEIMTGADNRGFLV